MDPLIHLSHVSFSYHTPGGETPALSDIDFSVYPEEFLAIVGPSGCGKSTLLSILSGLLKPEKGECLASDLTIGYMLQRDHLFEWRSIWKNVTLGLEIQNRLTPESRDYTRSLLKEYGLLPFADAHPSELSGGMRQRAALIRTLVLKPDLLLLDEPFSALDYQTRLNVSNDIGQILRHTKKTAILVTHDLSEAISLADRVITLTSRPATVSKIVPIQFDLEEDTPLHRRNAPEFKQYFNLLWKELNQK